MQIIRELLDILIKEALVAGMGLNLVSNIAPNIPTGSSGSIFHVLTTRFPSCVRIRPSDPGNDLRKDQIWPFRRDLGDLM